mgnify:CR=1 FL=1
MKVKMEGKGWKKLWIRGKLYEDYFCRDIGCPDFKEARENREKVKLSLFDDFYQILEDFLKHTSKDAPLPKWINIGYLPSLPNRLLFGGD